MNPDFDNNMKQLLQLLKKMVLENPQGDKNADFQNLFKSPSTMNVFFLNFFPMTPEELDEIEDILEEAQDSMSESPQEELKYELNSEDQVFLKRHGIQF